jgi:hypothetical protein
MILRGLGKEALDLCPTLSQGLGASPSYLPAPILAYTLFITQLIVYMDN